jgi:hypothetical protein
MTFMISRDESRRPAMHPVEHFWATMDQLGPTD